MNKLNAPTMDADLPAETEARLDRRQFLGSTAGAAGMLLASPLMGSAASAASGDRLNLKSHPDLLRAHLKMRASLDNSLNMGWLEGKRFSISEGRVEPLCGMRAATFSRLNRVLDHELEYLVLEISFYTDFETGEPIEEMVMPFSGSRVKVPVHRFGPQRVRFSVRLDETEHFTPEPGTSQAAFATAGSVSMTKSIDVDSERDGNLILRHEEYGRRYPQDSDRPTMFYRETTLWTAPKDQVLNPAVNTVDSEVAYSAMTSFRPWMEMGDIPGHTFSNGFGRRARAVDEIPKAYRSYVQKVHPDVLGDPMALLIDPGAA